MKPTFTFCVKKTQQNQGCFQGGLKLPLTEQILRTCPRYISSWTIITINKQIKWKCKAFNESLSFPISSSNLQGAHLGSFSSLDTVKSNQAPPPPAPPVSPGCFGFPDAHTCPTSGDPVGIREQVGGLALPSAVALMASGAAQSCSTTHPPTS